LVPLAPVTYTPRPLPAATAEKTIVPASFMSCSPTMFVNGGLPGSGAGSPTRTSGSTVPLRER
jgi:hypothetical protein